MLSLFSQLVFTYTPGYPSDCNHYTLGGIDSVKWIRKGSFEMSTQKPQLSAAEQSRADANRKVFNRLRRAHGQLAAVIAAVENEAPCRDTVQQLAAVSKVLDRAGYLLISTALTECLNNPQSSDREGPEELERLFLTLA